MRPSFLAYFFFFATLISFSQQKSFKINWTGQVTMQTSTASFSIPAFDRQNQDFNPSIGLRYITEWPEPQKIDKNSAELTNILYETISQQELGDLPLHLIPSKPGANLQNSVERNSVSAHLIIYPIIKENGQFKRITSFSLNYKYVSATASSSNNNMRISGNSSGLVDSNLSDGQFYRFQIEDSGIYRLSKSFLRELGVNVNSVNPQNIGIYGNGGEMLPYLNGADAPIDLMENAITFVGEEDGSLDDGDYILFYAQGSDTFNQESNTHINLYSNQVYYYVKVGNKTGKRIQTLNQPITPVTINVNTFQDYQYHEVDQYNLVNLGRRWFGDRFDSQNRKEFKFNFPNLVSSKPALVRVFAAAVSDASTNMDVALNGNDITNLRFFASNDPVLANGGSYTGQQSVNSPDITFTLTYNNNGNPSSLAYLDYISIEATRQLKYEGNQLMFYNNEVASSFGVAEYTIENTNSLDEVWDVTDPFNVSKVVNTEGTTSFRFKDRTGREKHYVGFAVSDAFQPKKANSAAVANQNLKGTILLNSQGEFQDLDYIIVTPSFLVSQAERLAQINRDEYGLTVKVVTLENIYLEFSSGSQDIAAIRNFIRYVYQNASSTDKRLKYLCLFGDSSYDYKNRISNNTNLVPSWHAYNSFSLTSSYISDDFFGMMDEDEGEMNNSDKLDIAIGRILVEDLQRAREMVDKIEQYYAPESYGSWRNNYIVVSDDVDFAYEEILQKTTNDIGNEVSENKPYINVKKIHSDAFEQTSSSSGERYPAVNEAMKDAIEVGAIALNYFGHGGEDGLALERIFDKNDAQELNNICKYNCFVTVTCEYTRFDNPQRPTAGEFTYWNTRGGAVSLLTTTRQIFVTVGTTFNVVMEKYLFSYNSEEELSIAEALRQTKNDPEISGLSQKRLVFFIGDPAMKLAIPEPNIRLTSINDSPIGSDQVLKALDKVKLSGEVTNNDGQLLSDFTGTLTATIFDKEISRTTLANDGTRDSNGNLIKLDFKTLGEIIFKGQASITNGLFSFEFVVPRDIGIPVGTGKASFYAKKTNALSDRTGADFQIKIGGINENAEEDNTGPIVSLFMNDENFVSGGITNEAPTLIAKLTDEHGINTASGIGHDIVAILDGDETNPYILNEYYTAEVDDFTKGTVSFPFRDLEPGQHTVSLKAWDVYNNSSISEIQFVVHDEDEVLVIENVLNYPNPFIDYTEFWFNHNSSDILDVSIQIFTVSGKLVRTLNGQTSGDGKVTGSLSRDITWDGRDDFGDRIGKGVYVYKLKVRSNQLNKQVEKIQKLVIL